MAKLVLDDLANLRNETTVVARINTNNQKIEDALENTLSRDGTSPNTMLAVLDMNSHQITHVADPDTSTDATNKAYVDDAILTAISEASEFGEPNLSYREFSDTGSTPTAPSSGRKRLYIEDEQVYVGIPSGTLGGPYKLPTQTTGSITVSTTDDWLDIITRHEGGNYIYFEDGTYDFGGTNWSPQNTNSLLRAQNIGGVTFTNFRLVTKGKYVLLWGIDIEPPDDGTYWFAIYQGSELECIDCCMDISGYTNRTSGIGFTSQSVFKQRAVSRDSVWDFGNRVTAQVFDIDSASAIKNGFSNVTKNISSGSWSGGTATLLHSGTNSFPIGSPITVASASRAGYNGTFTVTASSSGSVSYAVADPGGTATAVGTVYGQLKVENIITNDVAIVVADTSLGILTGTHLICEIPDSATKNIQSGTWSGGTTTLIHNGVNSFPVGSFITVAGAADSDYNGTFEVTASSAGSVSYADSNPGTTPIGAGGTVVARACGTGLVLRRNSGIVLANYCRVYQLDIGIRGVYGQSTLYSDTTNFTSNADAVYLDEGGVAVLTSANVFSGNTRDFYNDETSGTITYLNGPISTNGLAIGLGVGTEPSADIEISNSNSEQRVFDGYIVTNTLTVTTATSGTIAVGDRLWTGTAGEIEFNTVITALGTGTGGTGTYTVNNTQTVGSSGTPVTFYAIEGTKNVIRFSDTDINARIDQLIGALEFYDNDSSGSTAGIKAYIAAIHGTSGTDAALLFGTGSSSTGQATEFMRLTDAGNVGIGTKSPTRKLDISDDGIRVRTAKTPASAAATGNAGDICWDANYIYICTATNTWKRVAIATW